MENLFMEGTMMERMLSATILKIENILPILAGKLVFLIIIFFIWPKLIKTILYSLKKITEKKETDPLLISFLNSLIKTVLYIVLFFIIIATLGIQATSLVTILGTAGLAIGLALQGSLTNLASGLIILFFKNVSRGDYISVNNGAIEGTVESIHILYTHISTLGGVSLIVPNTQLANSPILNYSRNSERMLDLVYSTSYDDPIDKTIKILYQIIEEENRIIRREDRKVVVSLIKYNASSLDFRFRAWTKKEDYFDVLYACNKKVKELFDKNGIEIPYNKLDIYQKNSK